MKSGIRNRVNNYQGVFYLPLGSLGDVVFWMTEKGYFYREILHNHHIKRISAQEYQSAYEAYHNF